MCCACVSVVDRWFNSRKVLEKILLPRSWKKLQYSVTNHSSPLIFIWFSNHHAATRVFHYMKNDLLYAKKRKHCYVRKLYSTCVTGTTQQEKLIRKDQEHKQRQKASELRQLTRELLSRKLNIGASKRGLKRTGATRQKTSRIRLISWIKSRSRNS